MPHLTQEEKSRFKSKTRLVHAGRNTDEQFGFINTPIYRGSTVLFPTIEALTAKNRFTYATKGTPTIEALENAWSEVCGAAGTVILPSGLGAIGMAFMAVVKSGDHILMTDALYHPARCFCDTILKRMGVETSYYDPCIGAGIEAQIRPNTRVIFVESPASQTLEIQDIPAISKVARAHNICLILDNTWATPLFFSPHTHGIDLAIEAGTKYLSGHSDSLIGLISANETYWPQLRATYDAFAMCPGPEDVFLALRGLRTMELRLREAESQALELAHWLDARPEVARVLHPALPSHPGHALWKRDFSGSSGLFSIILHPTSRTAVSAMINGLSLFGIGYSWAGYQSLILPFDSDLARTVIPWKEKGPGLRLSVGLEDLEDLKADLDAGFARLRKIGNV